MPRDFVFKNKIFRILPKTIEINIIFNLDFYMFQLIENYTENEQVETLNKYISTL